MTAGRILAGLASLGLALTAVLAGPVVTTGDPHLAVTEHGVVNGVQTTEVSLLGETPASTAEAGNCTIPGVLCGSFKNTGSTAVPSIPNWGTQYRGRTIYPGQNTNQFYADTDGFVIYRGYTAWVCAPGGYCQNFSAPYGQRNLKITDAFGSWTVASRFTG